MGQADAPGGAARRRSKRILDAAEEVISERGFDNATVSEIVRRGKSSVGAMYARFNDKDSLLACLHERFCEQALATTDAALDALRWEGTTIAEILSNVLPFLVHVYHHKRGLIRAFIVPRQYGPSIRRAWQPIVAHDLGKAD